MYFANYDIKTPDYYFGNEEENKIQQDLSDVRDSAGISENTRNNLINTNKFNPDLFKQSHSNIYNENFDFEALKAKYGPDGNLRSSSSSAEDFKTYVDDDAKVLSRNKRQSAPVMKNSYTSTTTTFSTTNYDNQKSNKNNNTKDLDISYNINPLYRGRPLPKIVGILDRRVPERFAVQGFTPINIGQFSIVSAGGPRAGKTDIKKTVSQLKEIHLHTVILGKML